MRDIKKLFNEELPAALTANADKAKKVGGKFQLNVTGEGEWHLDLTGTGPSCVPGNNKADCTATIDSASLQKLLADPNSGIGLFLTGKLKVSGNQALGLKLKEVFAYVK
jgi:putative sterol carrier protein